jgi:hypothetical protein
MFTHGWNLAVSYYQCGPLSKGFSPSWLVIEKAHDALPFNDACRPVARPLSPLRHLVKSQAVLDGRAVDGNHKFGHWPYLGRKFVGAELGNCERYGLIEEFRLNFNIMRDAVGIGRRDRAPVHGAII